MKFGIAKNKTRKQKLKKIRRGWHKAYAWLPTQTLDGPVVWFDYVEKKYYGISRRVVKKDLNESELDATTRLDTMYRLIGSNEEKVVYRRRNGSPWVDANELVESEGFQNLLERWGDS